MELHVHDWVYAMSRSTCGGGYEADVVCVDHNRLVEDSRGERGSGTFVKWSGSG